MRLDLITKHSDDGCTAEVPTIKGCESWAHSEDEAIEKTISLVRYYLKLSDSIEIKIDKARGNKKHSVYKLVFNKP